MSHNRCLSRQLPKQYSVQGVLNSQYTYQEGRLACQLRSALSGLVFRKSLLVGSCHLGGHGPGNVQTLMSVDANRQDSWLEMRFTPLQSAD